MTTKLNENITIKFLKELYGNKKNVLWYGGNIAEVQYKDIKIVLSTVGEVSGSVYVKGEHMASFRDTKGSGTLINILDKCLPEIDNDKKLESIINLSLSEEDIKDNNITTVMLNSINWWTGTVYNDNNKVLDSYIIEGTDDLEEALKELVDIVKAVYENY